MTPAEHDAIFESSLITDLTLVPEARASSESDAPPYRGQLQSAG